MFLILSSLDRDGSNRIMHVSAVSSMSSGGPEQKKPDVRMNSVMRSSELKTDTQDLERVDIFVFFLFSSEPSIPSVVSPTVARYVVQAAPGTEDPINFIETTTIRLLTSGDEPYHVDTRGWRYGHHRLRVNDDDGQTDGQTGKTCNAVYYLRQGGYVFAGFCLSVCLSVCVCVC